MRYIFLILFTLTGLLVSSQDSMDAVFKKGNDAYTSGKYEIAVSAYSEILESGKHSDVVYFNLANSYYKLNEVAPAIYFYEKALILNPGFSDARNNLIYANRLKVDEIESLPENGFKASALKIAKSLSVDEWAYFSILIFLFTILAFVFYFYAQDASKKRTFFIIAIVGIILTTAIISIGFYAKNAGSNKQYAIVFATEFEAKSEPLRDADAVFTLHAGTKILVLEKRNGWALVQLENGNKAWMDLTAIKVL